MKSEAMALYACIGLLLQGCLVGPNYQGPPAAAQRALDQGHFERANGDLAGNGCGPSRWWDAVDDAQLGQLIDDALTASPRLQVALARVRSARAQLQVNRASLLPTGGASTDYVRARIPTHGTFGAGGATAGAPGAVPDPLKLGLYTAGFDASWELDIFGGTRRAIESARATMQSKQAAFEDAQIQLAGEVGKAYVQLREAQDRHALATKTVEVREKSLALMLQRRQLGTAGEIELQQQQEQLAQARAQIPSLQFTIDQQLDQLAILTGREPGALDATLGGADIAEPQPMPPREVPQGDPATWLVNRPDIRQAERTLAARNATIGQNVAAYFPQVDLLGLIGYSAVAPGGLVHGSPTSIAIPSLSWNLLNIPQTRAKVQGAEADRDEAAADYQRVVLEALQDANDSLSRFGRQRQAVVERQAALDAAELEKILTAARSAAGTATRLDELDAERAALEDDDQLTQVNSQLMQAYIALQKSLGLGWNDAPSLRPRVGRSTAP